MIIKFNLNGREVTAGCAPDKRVIDLLREDFKLTGSKEGCGAGECGACSILVDGESRLSCLMMAAQLEGKKIVTIEGLASETGELHIVQKEFIAAGAVQCGYCTPGMVITAVDFLNNNKKPSREEIREAISGNICRCTGYQKIVDAIHNASEKIAGDKIE